MINFFRMDMRRMIRSRWFYLTPAIVGGLLLFSFFLLKLVMEPELAAKLAQAGIVVISGNGANDAADAALLLGGSLENLLGGMLFSGGMMASILVIISSILVCEDFRCGFIKNVFSGQTKRGNYIMGKMLAFSALNLIYMLVFLLIVCALNVLMGFFVPLGNLKRLTMLMLAGWLLIDALIAQNLLFCMLTRNAIAGSILSILCAAGVVSRGITVVAGLFSIDLAPFLLGDLLVALTDAGQIPVATLIVAAGWLAVYMILALVVLKRRDVA